MLERGEEVGGGGVEVGWMPTSLEVFLRHFFFFQELSFILETNKVWRNSFATVPRCDVISRIRFRHF